jgi:hypothetical protein
MWARPHETPETLFVPSAVELRSPTLRSLIITKMRGAGMPVLMFQTAVGHAAAGGKAPLEVTGKDSPPPAEEVPVMGATEPVDEVVADEDDGGEGDDDNEGGGQRGRGQ